MPPKADAVARRPRESPKHSDLEAGERLLLETRPSWATSMYFEGWPVLPFLRCVGAMHRLFGPTLSDPASVRALRLGKGEKRTLSDMFESLDDGSHGSSGRRERPAKSTQFRDTYEKFARIVDGVGPNATIVSVGSSPDKLEFMAETLGGRDVRYMRFSRQLWGLERGPKGKVRRADTFDTDVFADQAFRERMCERLRSVLRRAGISMAELRDPARRFVFVDMIDTGTSIVNLMELLGTCLDVPGLTERTTMVILDSFDRSRKRQMSRHKFAGVRYLAAPRGVWAISKFSRCIPKATPKGFAPSKIDAVDIALCNAARSWVIHCT